MKTSDTISKIAAAMLQAQKAISFAAKDAKNPHFKNTYADLPAVVDAVKPALNGAGIVFIQSAGPSEDGRLNLTTRLQHESGEWIEDTLTMPLPKQDPQGYGSAMTYARRYALAAITGLYQDDDDGNAASGVQQAKPKAQAKPAGVQMDDAMVTLRECEDMEALKTAFGSLYTAATPEQRTALKSAYDKRKTEIETTEHA